ncbi:MAG: C45 family peptidase [Planctomycetota bacterium]|jgi:hypothetical protein
MTYIRSAVALLVLVAALVLAVGKLVPDAPDEQRRSFVPNWTGARESNPAGMTILRLAGTPKERGQAHGERLKERIVAWYERVRPPEGEEALFVQTLGPRAAAALTPELRAELEGIAAGSGLSFEQIWYLNLRFDLQGFKRRGFSEAAAVRAPGEVLRRFARSDLDDHPQELVIFVHLVAQPLVLVGLPGMAGGFAGTRGPRAAALRPVQEAPTPAMTGLAWPVLLRLLLERDGHELAAPATIDASVPLTDGATGTLDISPRGATWHAVEGGFAVAHPEPLSAEPPMDDERLRTRSIRAQRLFSERPPDHLVTVRLRSTAEGVHVTIHRDGVRFRQVIRFAD